MQRKLCLSALVLGLIAASMPQSAAEAQTVTIGPGGVHYNGYGQGYYGGYGQGYRGYRQNYYGQRQPRYSGYGNGPYGYGSSSSRMFPSNRGYGYGNSRYYNENGYSEYYDRTYTPVYSPIGFGVYNSYGW